MIEMTEELAEKIAHAALAKASTLGRPVSVSIVDESGRMVFFKRQNGAGFYTFDTSKAKAMAAASFKRSTMDITHAKDQNPMLWYSLSGVIPANALPSPGGRPLMNHDRCIGAIGIGGGSPDEDDTCCAAGQNAIE